MILGGLLPVWSDYPQFRPFRAIDTDKFGTDIAWSFLKRGSFVEINVGALICRLDLLISSFETLFNSKEAAELFTV
jgi:hypothetical protein